MFNVEFSWPVFTEIWAFFDRFLQAFIGFSRIVCWKSFFETMIYFNSFVTIKFYFKRQRYFWFFSALGCQLHEKVYSFSPKLSKNSYLLNKKFSLDIMSSFNKQGSDILADLSFDSKKWNKMTSFFPVCSEKRFILISRYTCRTSLCWFMNLIYTLYWQHNIARNRKKGDLKWFRQVSNDLINHSIGWIPAFQTRSQDFSFEEANTF